jgi:hypothetical protein
MKKNMLLALSLIVASGVFAEEYTIYLAGTLEGFINVQKEAGGKITIAPFMSSDNGVWIGNSICPILPKDGFNIWKGTKSIVIDGNTTTRTLANGEWNKTVTDGNTTMYTTSDGYWTKTIADKNTITSTSSRGDLAITVFEGNTLTKTYPGRTLTVKKYHLDKITATDSYEDWWQKVVVSGNKMTETDVSGSWSMAVINGNTTTVTKDGSQSYEEVIQGNTRTLTFSPNYGYKEVVDGNTITITSLDGKRKELIDKQGNSIFLTLTGDYCFDDIGVSEKDRVKNTIDGITSGRLKDGKFYELIDYGR